MTTALEGGCGVSVTPRPLFTPGKDPVHNIHEAGWAPGPVWSGAENLATTGIRGPDRPARIQSLYRRYPAHCEVSLRFLENICNPVKFILTMMCESAHMVCISVETKIFPCWLLRTRPDRPWGPHSLLYNGYRVFPGG